MTNRNVNRDLKLDQIQAQLEELAEKVKEDGKELFDSIVLNVNEVRNDILDEIQEQASKVEGFISSLEPKKALTYGAVGGAIVGFLIGILVG